MERFTQEMFKKPEDVLFSWDPDKITQAAHRWRNKQKWNSIYILAYTEKLKTHTHLGRVETKFLANRFRRYNSDSKAAAAAVANNNASNKKHNQHCKLVFYMNFPPCRNYATDEIMVQCRASRGWKSRTLKAMQIAQTMGLSYRVSKGVFDETSEFYCQQIKDHVQHESRTEKRDLQEFLVETYISL